jgi:hypothetical protein
MKSTMTERIWIILAAAMVIVAGAFLWRNNMSAAFVTATLGAVAWFLSYRAQLGAKLAAADQGSNEPETHEGADEK